MGYPRGLTLEGSVYIPPVTLTGYYAGHLKTAPPSRCQLSEVRPDPTRDGGLEPLDGELGVVKRIYALRSRGKTFRAIAEKLNKGGVPTKNGGQVVRVNRAVRPQHRPARQALEGGKTMKRPKGLTKCRAGGPQNIRNPCGCWRLRGMKCPSTCRVRLLQPVC